jgi:hypothetical protein
MVRFYSHTGGAKSPLTIRPKGHYEEQPGHRVGCPGAVLDALRAAAGKFLTLDELLPRLSHNPPPWKVDTICHTLWGLCRKGLVERRRVRVKDGWSRFGMVRTSYGAVRSAS